MQETYVAKRRVRMQERQKRKRRLGVQIAFLAFVLIFLAFLGQQMGNGEDIAIANGDYPTDLTIASNGKAPEEQGAAVVADNGEKETKPEVGAQDPKQEASVLPVIHYDDGDKVVYLTIDDGPSAHTEALLDILENYGVKASFFMLEPNMTKYPEQVKRMAQAGHAVGMHGVTHSQKKFYASRESVVAEMIQGQATLNALTGVTSHLIRVPYGSSPHMSVDYMQAVADAGLILWDWNVDSLDWKFKGEGYVAHTMKQVERLQENGHNSVILIHDTDATVTYLPKLLNCLLDSGYTLQVITDQIEPVQFKHS